MGLRNRVLGLTLLLALPPIVLVWWFLNHKEYFAPQSPQPEFALDRLPSILLDPTSGEPKCDHITPKKAAALRIRPFKRLPHRRRLSMQLAVYPKGIDFVSDNFNDHGTWESRMTLRLNHAFYVLQNRNRTTGNVLDPIPEDELFFVDIGSNIGSVAMSMWGAGIRTLAIDALHSNVAILKYSATCLNPRLTKINLEEKKAPLTVLHSALGSPEQIKRGGGGPQSNNGGKATCAMVSAPNNVGDAILVCDHEKLRNMTTSGKDGGPPLYKIREEVPLQTLDHLLEHEYVPRLGAVGDVHPRGGATVTTTTKGTIVKMDVEGQEWPVVQGSIETLLNKEDKELKPKLLVTEVWKNSLTHQEATDFATLMMVKHGYVCAAENVKFRFRPGAEAPPVPVVGKPNVHRSPTWWCSVHSPHNRMTVLPLAEEENFSNDHSTFDAFHYKLPLKPCVMTTVEQFTHWVPNMAGSLDNVHWVHPEWRPELMPWTQPKDPLTVIEWLRACLEACTVE